MAIKSKEEILNSLKSIMSENTSDEALNLIEDISDTVGDFEERLKDTTDWKSKYEENDKTWREKYRDRFFNSSTDEGEKDEPEFDDKPKSYNYDSLFTTKGEK